MFQGILDKEIAFCFGEGRDVWVWKKNHDATRSNGARFCVTIYVDSSSYVYVT